MKKNLLSLLLGIAFVATMVAGCGTKSEKAAPAKKSKATKESNITAKAVEPRQVYVSPEWVKSLIDGNQKESSNYVILEGAWGTEEDNPAYSEAHIPGSVHMNTDSIEEDQYWNIRSGEEIEKLLLSYGITKDTTVICYGTDGVNSADDRIALAALWAGVENVKCLDGGMEAWVNAGYDTEKGINKPQKTKDSFGIEVPAHPEYILTIDEVKEKLSGNEKFKLVSIRSKEEFWGETSGYGYIDKAGEPKGAIWGHDTDDGSYLQSDGTTAKINVLEGYLEESGASLDQELSFYCGTGWRAAIPFLMMYQEGYDNMTLFDGGWFVWQMDDANEIQIGEPASDDFKYSTVGELSDDKAKK